MITYKLQSLRATSDAVIRKYHVFSKVYELIIMFFMLKVKIIYSYLAISCMNIVFTVGMLICNHVKYIY